MAGINFRYLDADEIVKRKTHIHHSNRRKLQTLGKLMDEYGFCVPVIVDSEFSIIDGQARLKANQFRDKPDSQIPALILEGDFDNVLLSYAINNPNVRSTLNLKTAGAIVEQKGSSFFTNKTGFEKASVNDLVSRFNCDVPKLDLSQITKKDESQNEKKVTVIFEMKKSLFKKLKKTFDRLSKKINMQCFVRIDE